MWGRGGGGGLFISCRIPLDQPGTEMRRIDYILKKWSVRETVANVTS